MTNNTPDYEDNLYFDCKNCKYTDEYCASGDCNKISLTEQMHKGELPYAEYYIKLAGGEYTNDVWDIGGWQSFNKKGDVVVEVLARVPSYEVYKDLIDGRKLLREHIKDITNENAQLKEYERIVTSYNMKPIDYDIACETVIKLLDDNKRLKHDVGNLGYKIKNQRNEIDNRLKEIEKLKELLKEWIQFEIEENPNDFTVMSERMSELANKTKEVLK